MAYEEAKRTLWGCNPRHKPIARKHGALAIACQHTTQPTRTQTHGASKQRPIGHEGRVEVPIYRSRGTPREFKKKMGKATTMQEHVAHEGKNPYNGIKNVGIEPTTEVRAPPG